MNIRAEPGSSCSVYNVMGFGPHLQRAKLREFFKSYLQAGDLAYDYQKFVHLTSTGQLIHFEVTGFDFRPLCRFGLEISGNWRGPHVTLTYLEGKFLEAYINQVVHTIYSLACRVVPAGIEPRAKVLGRKGWPRWLRRHGLKIDCAGFVTGWQEYFNGQ